ncbi:MAG: hypothetical protein GYA02_11795 [Clostridiaceae bacterium]|nr:hypothetical protein [Clostridiaceae bacterium]
MVTFVHFHEGYNKFLEQVLSYVKFPFDRDEIRLELESHILEKIEYYIEQGYDRETAEQYSIKDMGDAREIGIALNKEHNPFLGWLCKITNVAIVLLSAWLIYVYGSVFIMTLFQHNPIKDIPESEIVYRIDINKKVQLDDRIIKFTNIVYEKDGDMNIFYEHYDTRLWGSGWSYTGLGDIMDNLGNKYTAGSAYSSGGIRSKCVKTVKNFSREADMLIISYDRYNRKYRVEIPLTEGDSNG